MPLGFIATTAITAGVSAAIRLIPVVVDHAKARKAAKEAEELDQVGGDSRLVASTTTALWNGQQVRYWPAATAERLELATAGRQLWTAGHQRPAVLLLLLSEVVGSPYVWSGQSIAGADCSGGWLVLHQRLAELELVRPLSAYRDRSVREMVSSWSKTASPRLGDVAVYTNASGEPIHAELVLVGGRVVGWNGGNSSYVPGALRPSGRCRVKREDYWPALAYYLRAV